MYDMPDEIWLNANDFEWFDKRDDINNKRYIHDSTAEKRELNALRERDIAEAKLAKAVEALEFLIGDIEWQPKSPSLKYLKQTLKEIKDG